MVRAEYSPVEMKYKNMRYCHPVLTICLGVLAFLLLAATITLLVLLLLPKDTSKIHEEDHSKDVCLTKDCIRTASSLIDSMDTTVEPCDDFYEFVCGKYIKNHPVPDEQMTVSVYDQYQNLYNRQLRDIIESDFTDGRSHALARAQEAYHVCLNTTYQSRKELMAFKKFINETLGGWPYAIGEKWKPRESLEEFLGNLYRLGLEIPFGTFTVEVDPFDPSQNIIIFRAPSEDGSLKKHNKLVLKAHRKSYISQEQLRIFRAYTELMKNTAKLIGSRGSKLDEDKMTPVNIMKLINDVEKINSISSSDDDDDDDDDDDYSKSEEEGEDEGEDEGEEGEKEYDEEYEDYYDYEGNENDTETALTLTMREMNELANGTLNWLEVLNNMFDGIYEFTEEDWISADEEYVKALSEFLTSTDRKDLANYVVWEVIFQSLPHGSPETAKYISDFNSASSETYRRPFRWVECTNWIQNAYPLAMTRFFVDKHVDPHSKEMVEEMVQMVQRAYKKMIKRSSWVDKKTKQLALKKASNMKRFISYPDFIFNDKSLEEFYNYLPSVKSVHFENFLDAHRNYTQVLLREYENPSIYKWDFNPLEINAFYAPWSNSIWFPTGILQLPFFDVTRPEVVNYAMIGSVIGHEVGHGFDNSGKDYDDVGRLRDWWTEEMSEKYENRTKCFVDQYNQFCPEELYTGDNETRVCVNGESTLGENIADITGLIAAYKAYKMWAHKYGKENRLPGLEEYSPTQLFFISFAYTWCENLRIENWEDIYSFDEHSPAKYRVLGTLPNIKEFAHAFGCRKGKMNKARERCELW